MKVTVTRIGSGVGPLELCSVGARLVALSFDSDRDQRRAELAARLGGADFVDGAQPAAAALRAYFDGDVGALDAIDVDGGGTPFQRAVWAALRRIPAGATTSYGELAAALGRPRAVRAVAQANAQNPIAIVVPCHRVVGRDGTLTGYGGGLPRKAWLLAHEAAHTPFHLTARR